VDKPIVGTLKEPDEDYGPNYAGAPKFQKMESYIQIYVMNPTPQKRPSIMFM